MTTRKKLIITTAFVSVAVLLAITALVIVLVANNNKANSGVRVQFTATNVSVDLSARYLVGDTWNDMTTNSGSTTLSLTPKVANGTLSPVASTIRLDSDNYILVFEYKFTSKMSSVGASIALSTTPSTQTNVKLTYRYSNIQLSNIDDIKLLASFDNYVNQTLGYNTTRYVYIVAEIQDLLMGAKLEGDFSWVVNRADVVKITYNNIPSTAVNTDNYEYVLKNTTYNNLFTYPFDVNKMFVGWGTSSTATTPVAFPKTFSSATTYYPIYASGGYDLSSYLSYDNISNSYVIDVEAYENLSSILISANNNVVIPDLYNGPNGIAPVTKACSYIFDVNGEIRYDYMFGLVQEATSLYIGNFVTDIDGLISTTKYNNAYPGYAENIYIGVSVNDIKYDEFNYIYITNAAGRSHIHVVHGNQTYDSRNNCNAIIETKTNTLITASVATNIPNNVVAIADGAYYTYARTGFLLTSVTIPSNVKKIGKMALKNTQITSILMSGTWYVSTSPTATSGTSMTVTDDATNAGNLTSNYATYYWYRTD